MAFCRQSFGRLANLMHSAVNYIHQKGPAHSIDIYTIAGRVTLNAISLSIFGEDLEGNEGNWEIRPEYACIFEPGELLLLDTPLARIRTRLQKGLECSLGWPGLKSRCQHRLQASVDT